MNLGFDAIAALPISTSGPDIDVTITAVGNSLVITIGSAGIIADSIVENLTPNPLTLGFGTLSIIGAANVDVTANPTTLGIGTFVITIDTTANPTGNALTLATGNVTINGAAVVNPTGSSVTLSNNGAGIGVITWNDIIPGANMVWTPIDPY